jgi:hypothetical protein
MRTPSRNNFSANARGNPGLTFSRFGNKPESLARKALL